MRTQPVHRLAANGELDAEIPGRRVEPLATGITIGKSETRDFTTGIEIKKTCSGTNIGAKSELRSVVISFVRQASDSQRPSKGCQNRGGAAEWFAVSYPQCEIKRSIVVEIEAGIAKISISGDCIRQDLPAIVNKYDRRVGGGNGACANGSPAPTAQ